MSSPSPFLDAALDLAAAGFRVFPLGARRKTPATKHGLRDATTDPEQIRRWWAAMPSANVGAATGEPADVLDVDGPDGEATLSRLVDRYGPLPRTTEQRTGRGRQFFFAADPRLRNSAGKIGLGIDVRAAGGYVVAPPSVHPTGARYAWTVRDGYAPWPEWLLEAQLREAREASQPPPPPPPAPRRSGRYGAAALDSAAARVAAAPEGTRNDTLNREAHSVAQLAAGGELDAAEAETALLEAARAAGLPEAEARRTLDSAFRAGTTKPRRAPEPRNIVPISSPAAPADVRIEPIVPEPERWPEPLDEAAYYGILGELARLIAPHTEADPVAVLAHELVFFGSAVGHGPHFRIGASRHHAVENCILVGDTSKGRKGTAEAEARRPYQLLEDPWTGRLASGLSTGEGLLHAVRDAVEKEEPIREGKGRNGRIVGTERVVADPGETDKRLVAVESEWGRVLRAMERDGSTLSSVIRQVYDCPHVAEVKTRSNPIRATDPHVSIVGHITREELLRYLDRTDQANGFANRFLYLLVRRSRELPNGGSLSDTDVRPIAARLGRVLETARAIGEMKRTRESQATWEAVYGPLSRARDGIVGGITNRAEAHVLRLSMVYALADGRNEIDVPHLEAALALWTYAEDSAEAIFGTSLGNPDADEILRNLAHAPEGLTRTELHACFGRNLPEPRLTMALDLLARRGLARGQREITPGQRGRPTERWFGTSPSARKNESDEINARPVPGAPVGEGITSSISFSRAAEHRECAS